MMVEYESSLVASSDHSVVVGDFDIGFCYLFDI